MFAAPGAFSLGIDRTAESYAHTIDAPVVVQAQAQHLVLHQLQTCFNLRFLSISIDQRHEILYALNLSRARTSRLGQVLTGSPCAAHPSHTRAYWAARKFYVRQNYARGYAPAQTGGIKSPRWQS